MVCEPIFNEVALSWIPVDAKSTVPTNAVEAKPGLYIIRARHEYDIIPGKWSGTTPHAFVSYGCGEIKVTKFDVLCNTSVFQNRPPYKWVPASHGLVPHLAVRGGRCISEEPLFIARAQIENVWCTGKVHPSHGVAYFPLNGVERNSHQYEVLCLRGGRHHI
ncbi:unnamed protein product [Echinostoma caproni]|uniref:DUF3421 domain-containing protein n=1 Tax=Echinostoma caproni TaxID=27848 RepID=A0A183AB72_9TREM|nr:unnamed protein product [Echinostoma caproni]